VNSPTDSEEPEDNTDAISSDCFHQEVHKTLKKRKGKSKRDKMADAAWTLSLIEHTSILGNNQDSYVIEEKEAEAFTQEEQPSSWKQPFRWIKKKVQGYAPILYYQVSYKVFDTQSHSSPVTVPKTFKEVQRMQGRELALWIDAINSEMTGLFSSGTLEACTREECVSRPIRTKFVFSAPI